MSANLEERIVITGLPPDGSGVGRLVQQFASDSNWASRWKWIGLYQLGMSLFRNHKAALVFSFLISRLPLLRVLFLCRLKKIAQSQGLLDCGGLVVLHPQTIGTHFVKWLIQRRSAPTWIYVVDSSFFCARQYNHIPGEVTPCLKCLHGDFSFAQKFRCGRSSFGAKNTADFSNFLRQTSEHGKVGFFVQNRAQAELVYSRLGSSAKVRIVGMWVKDFAEFTKDKVVPLSTGRILPKFNNRPVIVFHGKFDCAKGSLWTIQLAEHLPEFDFLFPFDKRSAEPKSWINRTKRLFGSVPADWKMPTPNCRFEPMSWETGLGAAVQSAFLALTPSLWSAPIEGALLKSLKYARIVGVVQAEYAFSTDIPREIVHVLPVKLSQAAREIRKLYRESVLSSGDAREGVEAWLSEFVNANQSCLNSISAQVGSAQSITINV